MPHTAVSVAWHTACRGASTDRSSSPSCRRALAVTQLIPPESLPLPHCTPTLFFLLPMLATTALLPPPPPPQPRPLLPFLLWLVARQLLTTTTRGCCCCFCCCCCNAALFIHATARRTKWLVSAGFCLRFKWTPCLVLRALPVQKIFFYFIVSQGAPVPSSVLFF